VPALRLAQLVLRWSTISVAHGRHRVSSFVVDMNQVFEKFIEHRLRRELREVLDVSGQDTSGLDEDGKVEIIPDLVFRRGGPVVYVADAKYKVTADGRARQADYYQMLAYCTAWRQPEGMLIYADTEGEHPPHEIVVRGSGTRIATYQMPIGGARVQIDRAIEALAAAIRCRAL
jgi:5-methylcytosine-specific restriction enzyme subunit McrC